MLDEAQSFSNPNEQAIHKNRIDDLFLLSSYLKWNYVIGMVTFIYFSYVQYKSQVILAGLRKNREGILPILYLLTTLTNVVYSFAFTRPPTRPPPRKKLRGNWQEWAYFQ